MMQNVLCQCSNLIGPLLRNSKGGIILRGYTAILVEKVDGLPAKTAVDERQPLILLDPKDYFCNGSKLLMTWLQDLVHVMAVPLQNCT